MIIYCRISTDEQRQQSIEDQYRFCCQFLVELGLSDADTDIVMLCDDGISGEVISRPGIDQVRERIKARKCDLLLCEDASRLYRNEPACFDLVGTGVDMNVRVICVNDFVDTAEEEVWPERLHDAMRQHGRANYYTRWRIRRTLQSLWEMGAAIGMLKPGYQRRPTVPVTDREPAQGPFFDEIDPSQAPFIHEAFTRIAANEPSWLVGQWLTQQGLPRRANAQTQEWDYRAIIELIRDPVYRGIDEYGATFSKKQHTTGRTKQVRNKPENVSRRDMPHLRIVPDHVWFEANAMIEARTTALDRPHGLDHALWGIPRDSRGPLSRLLVCGCCRDKMHLVGPNGYRCRNVGRKPKRPCWNKATAKCECVHKALAEAIRGQRARLAVDLEPALDRLRELLIDREQSQTQRDEFGAIIRSSTTARDNLLQLAEQAAEPPESLLERIDQHEDAIARAHAALEFLAEEQQRVAIPPAAELLERLDQIADRLSQGNRLVRSELEPLAAKILAVPFQQFGSNKVVLRARFELNPLGLVPAAVRIALKARGDELLAPVPDVLKPVPLTVDLFELSTGPKYWEQALKLKEQGWGPTAIGKKLNITKRQACLATEYGERLREAGLTDPFSELDEPPVAASRWGTRRKPPANTESPDASVDGADQDESAAA